MKKIRLILFEDCNRDCGGCRNRQFNFDELDIETDFTGYSEILLIGGEPMLKPSFVSATAEMLRQSTDAKLYLYTAKVDNIDAVWFVMRHLDGLTVSLHDQDDVEPFRRFNETVLTCAPDESFRLNVFKGINLDGIDLSSWEVKRGIEWIGSCPLPSGEVLRRLSR